MTTTVSVSLPTPTLRLSCIHFHDLGINKTGFFLLQENEFIPQFITDFDSILVNSSVLTL